MTTPKQPATFMRYAKVEAVLEKEPAFRKVLSAKDQTVFKPNGAKQDFCKEVIAVTDAIHADGLDAHTLSNGQIIEYGIDVLLSGKPVKKPVALPPEPKKAVKPAKVKTKVKVPARKVVKAKPVKVVGKSQSEPVSAPEPKAEPAPAEPAPAEPAPAEPAPADAPPASAPPSTPLLPPKSESAAASASPSAADNKKQESKAEAKPGVPRQLADGTLPYAAGVSAVSLGVSMLQIMEHYLPAGPKRDALVAKGDELVAELKRMTVIPKTCAKESTPAVAAS